MIRIRPIAEGDLPAIFALAQIDQMGLTGFPADLSLLEKKITRSRASFAQPVADENAEALYFFVMENQEGLEVPQVIGCCGIEARLGISEPFYSFKVDLVEQTCPSLHKNRAHQVLHMVNDYRGASEVCSLFLHPDFRSGHRGVALSRSRFLFMAQFPQLFSEVVMAEIRGLSDEQGLCPFWEAVGQHFLGMTFTEADRLTNINKQYISDLMPRYPIYMELLPIAAQAALAQPHPRARPAKLLLERQGFAYKGYIDIFDGGPALEARRENIATIRQSRLVQIHKIVPQLEKSDEVALISNLSLDFRVTMGAIQLVNEQEIIMSQALAECLQVQQYDTVRYVMLAG